MMGDPQANDIAPIGKGKRLGYLSAAPTVSTHPDALSAGPRAHILGVIKGFEAAGFEVQRFIVGDRLGPKLGKSRVQALLEASPLARYAGDLARLALGWLNSRRAFAELTGGSKAGAVDWVYERFATMQVLGHRFRRAGIPWILETQGLFYYETKTERQNVGWHALAKHIEIQAYRDCDVLVCISEPLKQLLIEECGINADKILVIPNAVDLDRFDPTLKPATRPFDELTLVFVGGLIEWQALDLLLQAMADLRADGLPLGLIIAGTGSMEDRWRALANSLGLDDRVRFLGHVPADQVARVIAQADLGYAGAKTMAIGSMYHSPIKLYEYMAMGRPAVAAAHDDARRLVDGHDTGWLFASEDLADLKRVLRQAADARSAIPQMGQTARQLIAQQHSWTARTQSLIQQLQTRLPARPTQPRSVLNQPQEIQA